MTVDGPTNSPVLRNLMGRVAAVTAAARTAALSARRSSTPPEPPAVGVFGKHPAFSDHITLPLPNLALRQLWEVLYNQNVQAVIDHGTWATMVAEGTAIPFGHWFCGGRGDTWIVGRIWASADKVGRREYPMVAAAAFDRSTPARAVSAATEVLCELEAACRSATTAEAIVAATTAATAALAPPAPIEAAPQPLPDTSPISEPPAAEGTEEPVAELPADPTAPTTAADALRAVPAFAGVERPLLAVVSPWSDLLFRPLVGRFFSGKRQVTGLSEPTRVPIAPQANESDALVTWATLARHVAGHKHPVFVAKPDGQHWVDLVVGPLQHPCCAALRKSEAALPPVTPEPLEEYPPEFLAWAARRGA